MSSTAVFPGTDLIRELVNQMRAIDTYGQNDRDPDAKLIEPFIVTREQKHHIPIVGDPDEETMARVKAYYNALSSLVEKATGLMAIPAINLTHEGFGRALMTVGKLVVFDRTLRDVHRFGFATPEQMQLEADKVVAEILGLIERYREVAEA
jgi:probable nitrogen fixation protein